MVTNLPSSNKNEYGDLSDAEKARLAGAIWIYGSIDIMREKKRTRKKGRVEKKGDYYYYPRIVLSMPNPLPCNYAEDTGGKAYVGKRDGHFTLIIKKQELVEKRLREILPFMGGEEKKQIQLALQIMATKRSELPQTERTQKIKELYKQWKKSQERLEQWIKDFKAGPQHKQLHKIPKRLQKIWNKAYVWEDC